MQYGYNKNGYPYKRYRIVNEDYAVDLWGDGYLNNGCMGRWENDQLSYTGGILYSRLLHGEGTIKSFKHHCSWTGKFNKDKFDGEGILTLKDGTTKKVTFPTNKEALDGFEEWVVEYLWLD